MHNQQKPLLDLIELRERWRKLSNYGCFWSSPDNPKGFQLTPKIEQGKISVEMKIECEHSGFPGIAQGGVAFTILDGLMGWYVMSHFGRAGFTTQANVEYLAPLLVGQKYLFQAIEDSGGDAAANGIVKVLGQVFHAQKRFEDPKTKACIQMKATFVLPNRKTAKRVLGIPFDPEVEELFPEK